MIQLTIQHQPKRKRHLRLLTSFLDLDELVEFHIVEDQINSASGMHKAFLSVKNKNVNHLLVLQDDVLPCRDLLKTSKKLIKILPNEVISLFTAYGIESNNRRWLKIDRLYGLCAYILPVNLIKPYLEFEKNIKDNIFADDVRLSMFLTHLNKNVYLTNPSLVEHICWDRTSQNNDKVRLDNALTHRIARNYIGFEESGLSIDWSKDLKNIPQITIGQKHDYIRHLKNDV